MYNKISDFAAACMFYHLFIFIFSSIIVDTMMHSCRHERKIGKGGSQVAQRTITIRVGILLDKLNRYQFMINIDLVRRQKSSSETEPTGYNELVDLVHGWEIC